MVFIPPATVTLLKPMSLFSASNAKQVAEKVYSRVSAGMQQVTSEKANRKLQTLNAFATFQMEAAFEAKGTIWPVIRWPFWAAIALFSSVSVVRYILVPKLLDDPNAPIKMVQPYWSMVTHLVPATVFLFCAMGQKETVQVVAKNPR